MLVVLLIVALLAAVAFAALFLTTRSAAAAERDEAEQRRAELQGRIDALEQTEAGLQRDLADLTKDRDRLNDAANDAAAEIRRLGTELDETKVAATRRDAEQTADIEAKAARIAELETDLAAVRAALDVAETAAASAKARASGIVIGELSDAGARPETLWNLELTRSERTWRTSVATNPEAPGSPFDEVDDPVRTAVEIEASALRENVGAFIEIDWQAGPVDDPTQRHLIVRVAQELLESAARSPEPSVLRATEDDDGHVSLSLGSADADAQVINIIPPQITSDLLDFGSDDGLNITVKAN